MINFPGDISPGTEVVLKTEDLSFDQEDQEEFKEEKWSPALAASDHSSNSQTNSDDYANQLDLRQNFVTFVKAKPENLSRETSPDGLPTPDKANNNKHKNAKKMHNVVLNKV